MTREEFDNLQPDQEVFFIKKVRIKDHMTFSSGVDRYAVRERREHLKDSYPHEKGDTWYAIKGAKGCKNANRALHLNALTEWYLDKDEALYAKLKIMDRAIKNCNQPSVKSQPAFKYKMVRKQKNVLKLANIYPEFFI